MDPSAQCIDIGQPAVKLEAIDNAWNEVKSEIVDEEYSWLELGSSAVKEESFECEPSDSSSSSEPIGLKAVKQEDEVECVFNSDRVEPCSSSESPITLHFGPRPKKIKGVDYPYRSKEKGAKGPFKCEYCDYKHMHMGTLNRHVRLKHEKNEAFVCSVCSRTFSLLFNLNRHMLGHTGERPYACDICDARFVESQTMKDHRRIHTGERPYACPECGKTFIKKSTQAGHIRSHARVGLSELAPKLLVIRLSFVHLFLQPILLFHRLQLQPRSCRLRPELAQGDRRHHLRPAEAHGQVEMPINVPFTVAEWHRVQSLFCSDNIADLRECHILLSMWCNRRGTAEMIAVSCSEILIASLIGAARERGIDSYMAHDEKRRQFVNYVNELGQKDASSFRSIHHAVSGLGVPKWVVDIRHAASHNTLPPLHELERAIAYVRKWMWDNFWQKPVSQAMTSVGGKANKSDEEAAERTNETATRIHKLIVEFMKWRVKNKKFKIADVLSDERPKEIKDIEETLITEPFDFLRQFISDGILILNSQQLEVFASKFDADKDPIPDQVQDFWDPVLTLCFEASLIVSMIIELLARLVDSSLDASSIGQLRSWATMFIKACQVNDMLTPAEWSRILTSIIAVPDVFSSAIIRLVMDQLPDLEGRRRRQVQQMLEMTMIAEDGDIMEVTSTTLDETLPVHTITDLMRAIERDTIGNGEETGGWTLCTDWQPLPLGLAPGQTYDNFSLLIEDHHLKEWERYERKARKSGEPPSDPDATPRKKKGTPGGQPPPPAPRPTASTLAVPVRAPIPSLASVLVPIATPSTNGQQGLPPANPPSSKKKKKKAKGGVTAAWLGGQTNGQPTTTTVMIDSKGGVAVVQATPKVATSAGTGNAIVPNPKRAATVTTPTPGSDKKKKKKLSVITLD